jgi:predicted kinase
VTDPIQVYDCVEFDRGLREIDVAADFAFLVMDLERLAGREPCDRLVTAYRQAGGDLGDPPLLAFLASYRAWVRAKVALFDPDRSAGRRRAAELHALGHRLAWRARLPFALWVCGGAASGKSTLAAALADVSGLPVIDADRTRKRLAGLKPTERAGSEHYSSEFNRRTYRELGAAAAAAVDRDGGVIIDATGRHRADRASFRDGLGGTGARLVFARCEASERVLLERARARETDPDRVSDAGIEEVARQIGGFEPLDEGAGGERATIDTETEIDQQVAAVEALLDGAILSSASSGSEARPPRR